jgi:hypothetical protein
MEKGTQRDIEGHWSRKKKIEKSIYKQQLPNPDLTGQY